MSTQPVPPEALARERPNGSERRHGRLWHAANIVGGLVAVGLIVAVTQTNSPASGVQVVVHGPGTRQRIPAGTLVQVQQGGSGEVVAGHAVPRSGRLTFRLGAGHYVLVVRAPGRGRRAAVRKVQVKGSQFADVTIRIPALPGRLHR